MESMDTTDSPSAVTNNDTSSSDQQQQPEQQPSQRPRSTRQSASKAATLINNINNASSTLSRKPKDQQQASKAVAADKKPSNDSKKSNETPVVDEVNTSLNTSTNNKQASNSKKKPAAVVVKAEENALKPPTIIPEKSPAIKKAAEPRAPSAKRPRNDQTSMKKEEINVDDEMTRDGFPTINEKKSQTPVVTKNAAKARKSLNEQQQPITTANTNKGKKQLQKTDSETTLDVESSSRDESASASNQLKKSIELKIGSNQQTTEDSQSHSQSQEDMDSKAAFNDGENTNQSVELKKARKKRRTSVFDLEHVFKSNLSVEELFVYKWPEEDHNAEQYVLQEQISEFLNIKSFKRKYPDIFRRFIDIKEREYLKENNVVTEAQCDLGLTALKLSDCLDLMAEEYPEKYNELNNYLIDQRRKQIALQMTLAAQKRKAEQQAMRANRANMSESDRLKEQMRRAMLSASDFNSQLQKEKREERNFFFDIQTFRVQKPGIPFNDQLNKMTQTTSKIGAYPVSILSGQYHNYFKAYTPEQLKYLPINTVLKNPPVPNSTLYNDWLPAKEDMPYLMEHYEKQQLEEEAQKAELVESAAARPILLSHPSTNIMSASHVPAVSHSPVPRDILPPQGTLRITAQAAPTAAQSAASLSSTPTKPNYLMRQASTTKSCQVCQSTGPSDQMITCSSCSRSSHQICLQLNSSLVSWQCIREYRWQCMDCKICSTCNQPHDEDKMMFCDRCDRGFHTYCVNMSDVPSGSWLCRPCKEIAQSPSAAASRSGTERRRGRPPGSLNKPKDPNSPKKSPKLVKPKKLNEIFDEIKNQSASQQDIDMDSDSDDDEDEMN